MTGNILPCSWTWQLTLHYVLYMHISGKPYTDLRKTLIEIRAMIIFTFWVRILKLKEHIFKVTWFLRGLEMIFELTHFVSQAWHLNHHSRHWDILWTNIRIQKSWDFSLNTQANERMKNTYCKHCSTDFNIHKTTWMTSMTKTQCNHCGEFTLLLCVKI